MKGFRDFILRGNLVELAVAFIMAGAFALVVNSTVVVIMDVIGKIGGTPDFSSYSWKGISIGAWFTSIVAFVIMAAVVYFVIVVPYGKAREMMARSQPEDAATLSEDTQLLTEIRDLLAQRPIS